MRLEELNIISGKILDCAIEVHRQLGPGLLESVYEACLCKEFEIRKINFNRQVPVPIIYKGERVNSDLKIDVLVENEIIIELKSVEIITPVYKSQLLTYLRLANKRLGLLINFNVPKLMDGYSRVINGYDD
jgi:GxxExxY protein